MSFAVGGSSDANSPNNTINWRSRKGGAFTPPFDR